MASSLPQNGNGRIDLAQTSGTSQVQPVKATDGGAGREPYRGCEESRPKCPIRVGPDPFRQAATGQEWSFDHLIGAYEDRWWNCDADRFCGL